METCTTYADAKLKKIKKQSAHLAEVVLTSAAANSVFEEFHCSHLVDIGVVKKETVPYLQVLLAWNVGRPQMGELVSSNSCVDTCAVHTRHSPVLVHWECNSRILLDARTLRNGSGTVCSVIWKTPLPVFCVQQGRLGV